MIKILIVEDERSIAKLIELSLKKAGYHCICAYDGDSAMDILGEMQPDLILLDIMLPGADGFEIMEYLRPLKIPVIFLTAKNAVYDKVRGLKAGAEDYIVKPFEVIELLARIEVVLRRYQKLDRYIKIDHLEVDRDSMVVKKNGEKVNLTNKEYELLLLFIQNPGSVLYRETIYERVWGGNYPSESRTVDLHIQRMRKKVGWEERLVSVPKIGYRLEVKK